MLQKVATVFFGCLFFFCAFFAPANALAANLYYNGATDSAWDTLENWWNDAGFTDPALDLPQENDTVYIGAQIDSGPSTPVALTRINISHDVTGGDPVFAIFDGASGPASFYNGSSNNGTVDGSAIFYGASRNNGGSVNGDAEFRGSYYETDPTGTVSGAISFTTDGVEFFIDELDLWTSDASSWTMATGAKWTFDVGTNLGTTNADTYFRNGSSNEGSVAAGDAYFYNDSRNVSTLTGSAYFYDTAINESRIDGDATFAGANYGVNPVGDVGGTVTFTTDGVEFDVGDWDIDTTLWNMPAGAVWIFISNSNTGIINGSAEFVDSGENTGTVLVDATFSGTASNAGTVAGNAVFTDDATNSAGTVTGNTTFEGDFYESDPTGIVGGTIMFTASGLEFEINTGSWTTDTSAWDLPIDAIWNFTDATNDGTILRDAHFTSGSINQGTVSGAGHFFGTAYNAGTVTGLSSFHGTAYDGDPTGTAPGGVAFTETVTFTIVDSVWAADTSMWTFGIGPQWIFAGTASNNGYIKGMGTFGSGTSNEGTIEGNGSVFNAGSHNAGTITGDATFNSTTHNTGSVSDLATFNGTSYNNGNLTGGAVFNGTSYNLSSASGGVIFNNSSHNDGTIDGEATFNDDSYNSDTVNGNATFSRTAYSSNPAVGVSGTITFTDDVVFTITNTEWNADTTVWAFNATRSWVFNGSGFNSGTISTAAFNGTSYNTGTVTGNATFNTTHYDSTAPHGGIFRLSSSRVMDGVVQGSVFGNDDVLITTYIFEDTSSNNEILTGNAEFRDTSSNNGTITGDACFDEDAANTGSVSGTVSVCEPEPVAPTVTTSAASAVLQTTATLNGEVTLGDDSTEHGFAYGTVSSLSTVVATTTLGVLASPASFVSNITGLTCATTYYARAYSTNAQGTGYSTIVNFTTPDCTVVSNPDPEPEPARRTSGGSSSRRTANQNTVNRGTEPVQVVNNTAKPVTIESFVNLMVAAGIITTDQLAQVKAILSTLVPAPQSFSRDLTVNDTGEDVVALQRVLIAKGYLSGGLDTGTFGPLTLKALKAYQAANGIPSTGYFGPLSRAHVGQ